MGAKWVELALLELNKKKNECNVQTCQEKLWCYQYIIFFFHFLSASATFCTTALARPLREQRETFSPVQCSHTLRTCFDRIYGSTPIY